MSTFYVLPSREVLGGRLAGVLQSVLPGLETRYPNATELADILVEMAETHNDVFVVFREDLTGSIDILDSLQDIFGAGDGDTVVEIDNVAGENNVSRIWQIVEDEETSEEKEVPIFQG